jgi:hypothetical protein
MQAVFDRTMYVVSAVAIGVTAPAASGQCDLANLFGPAQQFATDQSSYGVVIGDFDSDGTPDLAVSNQSSNNVSVLLGNGDGTFQPRQNYPTDGSFPRSLAGGDLDGDGVLDLVVVNEFARTIRVLLGNGDGTFQTLAVFSTGSNPFAVAIADLNADGVPDIAVTNRATQVPPVVSGTTVSVLLGNGNGTFQARQDFETGTRPNAVVIGDFDADGTLDLVVANADSKTVSVLLGIGDGTFHPRQDFDAGDLDSTTDVKIGDLDNNGTLDIVVTNRGLGVGNASVLLGNGDGTFQPRQQFETGPGPNSVAIGDLDGDGIPDLAVANTPGFVGSISILRGNGDGTFQLRQDFSTGVLLIPVSVAIGDLNGDGTPDLAATTANSVSVLLNQCDFGAPCPADLVPPFGVLDLADINAFTIGFTSQNPIADLAPPFGVFDLADVGSFVGSFVAGCP